MATQQATMENPVPAPHTSGTAGGVGGNGGVSFHPIDDNGKDESNTTSITSIASCGSLGSASTSSNENDNIFSSFLSLGDFSSEINGNGGAATAGVAVTVDGTSSSTTKAEKSSCSSSASASSSDFNNSNSLNDDNDSDPSIAKGGVSTPFPWKLHIMLEAIDKEGDTNVVTWLSHGKAFIVHKPKDFVNEIMPKFFNQSKYASFQRQLNLYGFQRLLTGPDKGAYYHGCFVRGQPSLCKGMIRQKVKGTKVRRQITPEEEPNFYNGDTAMPVLPPPPSKTETKTTKKKLKGKGKHQKAQSKSATSTTTSKTKTTSSSAAPGAGKAKKKKVKTSTSTTMAPLPLSGTTATAMAEPPSLVNMMQHAPLPPGLSHSAPSTHSVSSAPHRAISNESFRSATSNTGGSTVGGASNFVPPRTVSPQSRSQQQHPLFASFLDAASNSVPPITAKGGDQLFFEGLPFRYMEHWDLSPTLIAPRPSSMHDAVSAALATATAATSITKRNGAVPGRKDAAEAATGSL
mmetsp:Transcript_31020/g.74944  ORF Transcript_31020/g.74944 Transcript_31020/m.74944 type:complete len:518 (-) Transcript_31020:411-1964(-)